MKIFLKLSGKAEKDSIFQGHLEDILALPQCGVVIRNLDYSARDRLRVIRAAEGSVRERRCWAVLACGRVAMIRSGDQP